MCDIGGWTDTWFAQRGAVLNIAIAPRVSVQLRARPRDGQPRLVLHAEDWGQTFAIDNLNTGRYEHDPIVEAAVDYAGLPDDVAVELSLSTNLPEGAGTGSSAPIIVATLAALDRLTPGRLAPHQLAQAAHHIETKMAGEQAGVQDHIAAACGGIQFIEVDPYPQWTSSTLPVPDRLRREFDRRLVLVCMGQPHDASRMHEQVIPALATDGPDHPVLKQMRRLAGQAADAIIDADIHALGRVMTAATQAQAKLHPSVVTDEQEQVFEIARKHNALGFKQNGAGGPGGSVSILGSDRFHEHYNMLRCLRELDGAIELVPITLSQAPAQAWEA